MIYSAEEWARELAKVTGLGIEASPEETADFVANTVNSFRAASERIAVLEQLLERAMKGEAHVECKGCGRHGEVSYVVRELKGEKP
jgi:hypothetical protein